MGASRTWSGGSLFNDNWSSGGALGNWSLAGAPVANDSLSFAGSSRTTPNNDLTADTSFASITFNSGAAAFTIGGNRVTLGGNVTNNSSNLQTINLAMILSADRTFTTSASGGDLTIGGVLSETGGARGIIKAGTGILTLSGINTYTGGTTVSAGTLQLSGSGTLGSTSGALTINGGTLDLNGTSQGVGNFTGSGGTVLNNSTGTNVTLTIGNSNGTGGNYSGVIADHTSGTGTVALTKTGTGTITLSGANTYSGGTTVSAGTLFVNNSTGSGTGTGAVTVNSTGTLGGSGTITGAVNVSASGATINPGATAGAVGTLATGALTLSSASVFSVDMTSTTADQIAVTGAVNITSASLQLNIPNGTAFAAGQTFTLINNDLTDAISGTFSNAPAGTDTIGGYLWIVSYTGGTGNDFLLTAVPEPSTWAAGALALGAIICSQRKRVRAMLARIVARR